MKTTGTSKELNTLNHELRTSSCGILAMVEVLRHESLTLKQLNYLQNIQQCGEHLLAIVIARADKRDRRSPAFFLLGGELQRNVDAGIAGDR